MTSDDDMPVYDEYYKEEQTEGRGSSQIFALTWVKQKAAKLVPDRIQLSAEELKTLFEQSSSHVTDDSSDSESIDQSESSAQDDGASTMAPEVDDDLKEFDFENYNAEPDDVQAETLSSLAVFPSNEDDPYMTSGGNDEFDHESEDDAINLRDDDSLLVCARCERDFATLEVFVYNRASKDFYVHHDIALSSAPLCMEWLDFDAGGSMEAGGENKGNFVATGNMDSVVEVWDLDVVNTMEPAYCLGVPKRKQKKYLLSGADDFGHKEAVLDLSWTPLAREKLASGSADHTVALWDLEKFTMSRKFKNHKEKVQTLAWKPDDQSCLLSGAFDGRVIALDTRSPSSGHSKWRLKDEIERLAWRKDECSYFAVGTNTGTVHYCDVRKPTTSLYSFEAHDGAVPALSMTTSLLYSGGSDGLVKIWELGENAARLLEEKEMKMGMVHCLQVNPDLPSFFAIGGQKGGVRLWSADWSSSEDRHTTDDVTKNANRVPDDVTDSSDFIKTKSKTLGGGDVIETKTKKSKSKAKKLKKNNDLIKQKSIELKSDDVVSIKSMKHKSDDNHLMTKAKKVKGDVPIVTDKRSSDVTKAIKKKRKRKITRGNDTKQEVITDVTKYDVTVKTPCMDEKIPDDLIASESKVQGSNKSGSKRKRRRRKVPSTGVRKVRLYPKQRKRMRKKTASQAT